MAAAKKREIGGNEAGKPFSWFETVQEAKMPLARWRKKGGWFTMYKERGRIFFSVSLTAFITSFKPCSLVVLLVERERKSERESERRTAR